MEFHASCIGCNKDSKCVFDFKHMYATFYNDITAHIIRSDTGQWSYYKDATWHDFDTCNEAIEVTYRKWQEKEFERIVL